MYNYKLRIYETKGSNKGNLRREEFFETKEEMDRKYEQYFSPKSYVPNPSAWEKTETGKWVRISGY